MKHLYHILILLVSFVANAQQGYQPRVNGVEVVKATNGLATDLTVIGSLTLTRFFTNANTNIVIVAPYDTAATGAGNIGPTTGQTSYEWLGYAHQYRVRQNGTVLRAKVNIASLTGVTGFYIKGWVKVGSTYNQVWTSTNLVTSLTASVLNTLTVNIPGVSEGDFIGARITYSSASAQVLTSKAVANAVTYSVLNATPATTGYAWESQTASTSVIVPIELYMTAPMFVGIGDSIMSGRTAHIAFDDTYLDTTSISSQMPYSVGRATGYTYQNMGISGQTTAQTAARFAADVAGAFPRFVIIEGGVNDLLGSTATSVILTNIINQMAAAQSAGIVPVVSGILPFRGYISATDAMSRNADTINNTLSNLVTLFGGLYVSPDSLAIPYATGDAGNLWKLNSIYDSGDGIHPNPAGHAAWASAIISKLTQFVVKGGITVGTLNVGGNIQLSGDNDRAVQVLRNTNYLANGGNLTVGAGGATGGGTDLNGGDLILDGGVTTGAAKSRVRGQVPLVGASGTVDNAFTDIFSFERGDDNKSILKIIAVPGKDGIIYFYDTSGTYLGGVGSDASRGIGFFSRNNGDNAVFFLDSTDSINFRGNVFSFDISNTTDPAYRFYNSSGVYLAGFGYNKTTGIIGLMSANDGTNPRIGLQATNEAVGISATNTVSIAGGTGLKLSVLGGTDTVDQNTAIAWIGRTSLKGVWVGYNTNTGVGYIGSVNNGVSHGQTAIAGPGGDVTLAQSNLWVYAGGGIKAVGSITNLALSPSLPVKTGVGTNLISGAIDLSGTEATGTIATARLPGFTGVVTNAPGSAITGFSASSGSGAVALTNGPTISSPTLTGQPGITDFTLANHTHIDTAHGGIISAAAIGSGTLALVRGGTGQTTRQAAFDGLAPVSPSSGDTITWNGTHWTNSVASGGSGTVTNVDGTANEIVVTQNTTNPIIAFAGGHTGTGKVVLNNQPLFEDGAQIWLSGNYWGHWGTYGNISIPLTAVGYTGETNVFLGVDASGEGLIIRPSLGAEFFNVDVKINKNLTIPSSTGNSRAGNLTLSGGTKITSNTSVTTNTIVLLTRKTSGGTIGTAITYTVSAGSSFTVNSDNILDASTFSYLLIEAP